MCYVMYLCCINNNVKFDFNLKSDFSVLLIPKLNLLTLLKKADKRFKYKKETEATPIFIRTALLVLASNIGLSDTAVMDMMVATLQQQRAVTEQLRREAAIRRVPVSIVVADIVKFINEHDQEDCLLVGFSSQKVNPFREKSSCTVL